MSGDANDKGQSRKFVERLQLMMERTESMAHLASFEWDVDDNAVTWSPEMYRIFGRNPAHGIPNLEGQAALYTPESAQKLFEAVGKAVTDGTPYELELMTVRPDGEQRPCYIKAFPERDDTGRVIRIAGLLQDITERKRLEKRLLVNEREFRILAESIPQIVWITRPDGWNIYFNQRWVTYTGMSLEESHGHGWNIPFHPEEKIIAWNKWQAAVTGTDHYSLECRLRRADGEYRWWLVQGRPVFNENGTIDKWFGTCTDIHDMKQAEQELNAAAAIEREMAFRNVQLSQELARRNADLSALTAHVHNISEEEKSRLARELHDELGSILVAMNIKLDHVTHNISAPELLDDLADLKSLLDDAAMIKIRVINQLTPTVLDDFGLDAALERLVGEYKKHTKIGVTLILPGDGFVMEHLYSLAAYRITQECLTNVAKHAGASHVVIEGSVCDNRLSLIIRDNGKGFHEAANADGHGIFGMIERARYLGGTIEFTSNPDRGSTVRLILPLAGMRSKDKTRVLLVDDHAIVRNAIKQIIEDQTDDFSVEGEAADGQIAVEMALEGDWDIVLLDINLPKMNGIEVLKKVKLVKPDLPIIMLSSYPESEYGEISISHGAACYIEKSRTDKLIETIRWAADSRRCNQNS